MQDPRLEVIALQHIDALGCVDPPTTSSPTAIDSEAAKYDDDILAATLRSALVNGCQVEMRKELKKLEATHKAKISHLCRLHHSTLTECVEALGKVGNDMQGLKKKTGELNRNVMVRFIVCHCICEKRWMLFKSLFLFVVELVSVLIVVQSSCMFYK